MKHWQSSPPVHVALAAFLGYKPAAPGSSSSSPASAAGNDTGSILDMLTDDIPHG